jgi:hypothetical protein
MPPAVIAAAGAIKGAVAAAGIMKSMAIAGTAMSALGAVTKNPKLTKIGAVVGGIGTLGTMGAFGAGAKTLGMSQAAKSAATTFAAPAGQSFTRQALQGQGPLSTGYQQSAQAGGGLLRSQIADRATTGLIPPPPTSLFQKAGAALKTGVDLVKDNPEVAQILATGGVELSNYLSGKTDAEIRDLEAGIDVKNANAQSTLQLIDQEKRRRQNLNQGYLTVNPTIAVKQTQSAYQPPGLLSQNMQRVPV